MKTLGIVVGIVLGILILIVGGVLLVQCALNQISPASDQADQSASSPTINLQPSTTAATIKPTVSSTATSPTPTSTSSSTANVNFDVQVTNISESGLTSRTVTAEIINTGNQDSHNVTGKIEVFSSGKQIKIGGQNSISQTLGTIKAGQKVTAKVDLAFSVFDIPTLTQNGVTVNLTITSDEKTQTIEYFYKP